LGRTFFGTHEMWGILSHGNFSLGDFVKGCFCDGRFFMGNFTHYRLFRGSISDAN